MLGGFCLALVVAIAEAYFLFKKLIELDNADQKSKAGKLGRSKRDAPTSVKPNLKFEEKSKIAKKED